MVLNPGQAASTSGTTAVYFDPATPSVSVAGTAAVYIHSTAGTLAVNVGKISDTVAVYLWGTSGTIRTKLDPESVLSGIQSSINVRIAQTAGTLWVKTDTDSTIGAIRTALPSGTNDLGNLIRVKNLVDGTLTTVTTVGAVTNITNSIAAHLLSTAGTIAVNVGKTDGTVTVRFDPGYELGSIKGISNSIAIHHLSTGGTLWVKTDTDSTVGAIRTALPSGTNDLGNLIRVKNLVDGTLTTVTTVGAVTNITNSVAVHIGSTGGTLGVRVGQVDGSVAVYFSPSNPAIAATFSGSIAAVPTSGSGSTLYDETADAVRVLISGSHSAASLQIKGITETIGVHLTGTAGTIGVRVGQVDGTVAVYFSPANPTVNATFSSTSLEVVSSTGSRKAMDDAHAAQRVLIVGSQTAASLTINGTLTGITNSIAVHVGSTGGTLGVRVGQIDGSVAVYFSPANPTVNATFSATSLEVIPTTGSRIMYDLGHQAVRALIVGTSAAASLAVSSVSGTVTVKQDPDGTLGAIRLALPSGTNDLGNIIRVKNVIDGTLTTVSTVAAVTNITNSVAVHLLSTGGTLNVKLDPASAGVGRDDVAFVAGTGMGTPAMGFFDDTSTDSVDEGDIGVMRMTGNRIQMIHTDGTASIFTASGSVSGVSVSGNQIIAPSANASFKIYAFSIQTTAQVSLTCKFTNGAGTGPTEFFRPLVTASGVTGAQGANLSTGGPGNPLFVTGTSTTLALVLDSASLVHYSVSYTKESA